MVVPTATVEPQLTVYLQLRSDYRQEISHTGFPLARPPMPHPYSILNTKCLNTGEAPLT